MCTLNVIFISDTYKIIYMSIHKSGGNIKFSFYFLSLLPNTIVNSVKLILLDVFLHECISSHNEKHPRPTITSQGVSPKLLPATPGYKDESHDDSVFDLLINL